MTHQEKAELITNSIQLEIAYQLRESRIDALDEALDVINGVKDSYDALLGSPEAWNIYLQSQGERFRKLNAKRQALREKSHLLSSIIGDIYRLRYNS